MGEDLRAKNPLWYGSDITPYEVMINHHSYTQLKQLQNLSEKNLGLNGIHTNIPWILVQCFAN